MTIITFVNQCLNELNLTQLRQLNREFGLATNGNRSTLINRLMVGPKQIGGARSEAELRKMFSLDKESNETQWPWGSQLSPSQVPEALEGLLLSYLDYNDNDEGFFPDSIKEADIKAQLAETGFDLKLDYSPIEWYHILLSPKIRSGKRPPYKALPAYAKRFAGPQLSQLSYPQLRDLQKKYPGYFDDFLVLAIEKMERLKTWLGVSWSSSPDTLDALSKTKSLLLARDPRVRSKPLKQIPPEIGQLTNLVQIDLARNEIWEIPPEIGQLTNLEYLDLSQNIIKKIPPEIGKLTNLEELNLQNNRLSISGIPDEIGQLPNLKGFYLDYNTGLTTDDPNQISVDDVKRLKQKFGNHITFLRRW